MSRSDSAGRVGQAILINLIAILLLDLMGLIIKHLSGSYGAAELSAYRNLFGLIPAILVLSLSRDWRAKGYRLRLRQWPLACLRGAFITLAQFLFYLSLGRLAFATATTISFSMSLFIVALSVPILGDRVGLVRWAAVMIGFAGVTMVIGPGQDSFSTDALLPVGAAICYALTAVTARLFDDDAPTPKVNLYTTLTAAAGAIALTLSTEGFTAIASTGDLAWICLMGLLGGSGVLCLIVSFRMTEPSNLAPFHYFGILFAFGLGWIFFGEAPVDRLFPGAILIVASGLIIVWRERRMRRS